MVFVTTLSILVNIQVAHWANHVRPQRWANNPPGKEERKKGDCSPIFCILGRQFPQVFFSERLKFRDWVGGGQLPPAITPMIIRDTDKDRQTQTETERAEWVIS